ncbi:thioredoxin [Gloeocapsopsis dulcis]|uniref:Thioredoxin n=1 Tax=Gloeocapsopsis dulcis AAB1 = 1H9 TaxID=1433147 RepID=A0A6N8G6P4_9CHRO|nr:thioredoxin [Gloeocapsopsis dulcis]MUL39296.1 thioredoxin [Gloeocapsopsis dulcis AAB1 = 1H9]WNN87931.1 thioredoxin [Gloeocapsopsis dulcis]
MATKQQFKNFEELLAQSHVPVLVDFYADWCGPCQMMAAILERVNTQFQQQLRVVKIDTEKYPEVASQHQVQALPTLVLFKHGQAVERIEGVMPADALIQKLQTLL